MTFWQDQVDRQDAEPEEVSSAARVEPRTALWSRRGLLWAALSCAGWLLVIPVLQFTRLPSLFWGYLAELIWVAAVFAAAAVSITAILIASVRRSWGVALASVVLAATGVVAMTRLNSPLDFVGYQYREHRTALVELAEDYRAGRLPNGSLSLPPDLHSLCSSGWAYATSTEVFVQAWQDWRAERGTGFAYFAGPPTGRTGIWTAEGDTGRPQREMGDGWWFVA